ncbi:prephenate dehydrogenase [Methylomagnum ishizawai]|uniref:prephenate dehydrogenase n=1 Tax=Methylomagnum ishizawai TaxID=1760988 RepID=A0A1Y6CX01_9GAMM|nr:prephenate dehydrogenase/arogenate dehydrogenase family protein [Methylomagnum ishizawai]SMF94806.1 prephenate dehydrogenase [Methylomagnum ishizawai]
MIQRLCVIGVGLIGGSIACGTRAAGEVGSVVGVDADAANLRAALDSGVIDCAYDNVAEGAADCDLVVIATPVGAIESVLKALRPVWSDSAVYTDVGSTKGNVIAAAERVFGAVPPNFVPGHPIAGAERSGVGAAKRDLYAGKRVILTPLPETRPAAVDAVETLWRCLGARVSHMAPGHHDEVLAATSHLPHVLAFALTAMLGRKDEQDEIFQYAAGGFRDFTRIASSDPAMWRDICLANSGEIVALLELFRAHLEIVESHIKHRSADELFALFTEARDARQRFLDQLEK